MGSRWISRAPDNAFDADRGRFAQYAASCIAPVEAPRHFFCRGEVIEVDHLPERTLLGSGKDRNSSARPDDSTLEAVIRESLARHKGNRAETARELGMHRSTLWRKMRQYGICATDDPGDS